MPDPIPSPGLDLSTPEAARATLAAISATAKEARDESGRLRADLTRMAADLTAAQQRLVEAENRAAMPAVVGAVDREISEAYLVQRGAGEAPVIRWVGESTEEEGWTPGLLDSDGPLLSEWQRDVQRKVEEFTLINLALANPSRGQSGRTCQAMKARRRLVKTIRRGPAAIVKAFDSQTGTGGDWIPVPMLPEIERELRASRKVAALFQVVPMSKPTLDNPFESRGLRPYLKGVSSGDSPAQFRSSSPSTEKRSPTAVGFAVRVQVHEDSSEDAVAEGLPIMREDCVLAMSMGEEDVIINGDTGTHQDALATWNPRGAWGTVGNGASDDHRRGWIGLRARAVDVASTSDGSAAQTYAGFLSGIAQLDSPHGIEGDLVCIPSPEHFISKMLGLAEVVTMDKLGSKATVLTGQLAVLAGKPIIPSEWQTSDLAATGLYTGTGATTGYTLVNRQRFKMGVRRASMVDVDKDITRGLWDLVLTVREILFTPDVSARKNLHYRINLSAS